MSPAKSGKHVFKVGRPTKCFDAILPRDCERERVSVVLCQFQNPRPTMPKNVFWRYDEIVSGDLKGAVTRHCHAAVTATYDTDPSFPGQGQKSFLLSWLISHPAAFRYAARNVVPDRPTPEIKHGAGRFFATDSGQSSSPVWLHSGSNLNQPEVVCHTTTRRAALSRLQTLNSSTNPTQLQKNSTR
jgi:hypothetical protein